MTDEKKEMRKAVRELFSPFLGFILLVWIGCITAAIATVPVYGLFRLCCWLFA